MYEKGIQKGLWVTGSQLHHKSKGLSSLTLQSQHKLVAGKLLFNNHISMNKISEPYIVSPVLQNFPLYFKPRTTFIGIKKIQLTISCTGHNCHFTSRMQSQYTLIPQIRFQYLRDVQFAVGPQNTYFQHSSHFPCTTNLPICSWTTGHILSALLTLSMH